MRPLCVDRPGWPGHGAPRSGRGFSLIELLVVLAIVAVLASIFIPYLLSVRERNNRVRCAENLRRIGLALSAYANDNRGVFPRVVYDQPDAAHSYTCFTGPDDADPFAPGSAVSPNDVTASLWLLVRQQYIGDGYEPVTDIFVCPSSRDWADPMADASGRAVAPRQRGNFREPANLSYSYCSPFSDATRFGMRSDTVLPGFAVMADKNPGVARLSGAAMPPYGAVPLDMARANSANHGGAGQNVLFGDMHVDFETSPYCGVDGDNIYTAVATRPIFTGIQPDMRVPGYTGQDIGPAWQTDSYLVPTATDVARSPLAKSPTTAPAIAATAPATTTAAPAARPRPSMPPGGVTSPASTQVTHPPTVMPASAPASRPSVPTLPQLAPTSSASTAPAATVPSTTSAP